MFRTLYSYFFWPFIIIADDNRFRKRYGRGKLNRAQSANAVIAQLMFLLVVVLSFFGTVMLFPAIIYAVQFLIAMALQNSDERAHPFDRLC